MAAGRERLTVRLLLVDLGRDWRGGQEQALFLMKGLLARGHAPELLAVRGAPLAVRARACGIPVHMTSPRAPRFGATRLLRRLLRAWPYDLLHANEAHALTSAWFARAHRRTPVVAARRVALPLHTHRWARAQYLSVRRMIAVSRFVGHVLLDFGLPASVVPVVYDGVEMPPAVSSSAPSRVDAESRRRARARWGAAPDQPLVGCVGHLVSEKGHEFLLRALPAVRERIPNCRLVLAGDGPCRVFLERLAKDLGVADAVHFAGEVVDVAEVYRALDVFAFPSLAEPLGSSMLTAMAWEIAVVAAAGGAVPEAIEADRSGLLVPAGDAAALAAALVRLLSDRELSARLGDAARQVVQQRFTADRMVEATLEIYSGLLRSAPGAVAEPQAARG